jgi:hypothetical protein
MNACASRLDATGFRNLLMMDTYQHVRQGVRYPPFLISMGLNDPRIAAWQRAKLAARLLALGNPTLLRVNVDGGHGVGATRSQITSMYVDFFTFAFWQSGYERLAARRRHGIGRHQPGAECPCGIEILAHRGARKRHVQSWCYH